MDRLDLFQGQEINYFPHNYAKNRFLEQLNADAGTLVIGEEGGKFDAAVILNPGNISLITYIDNVGWMQFDIERSEFIDLYISQSGPQALHCLNQRQLPMALARRYSPRRSGESNSDRLLRLGQVLETEKPDEIET